MININGSRGEGGGQVLRTALSLSACTGQAFKIRNIRGNRKKPGLMRQHLTCVKAVEKICGGKAVGAHVGSTVLSFTPGDIKGGDYTFDIGTAGATNLVFQTVLPVLLQADGISKVNFKGGTHNKAAPPYEFITESFLPILKLIGVNVVTRLIRHGFYPAGGGEWEAEVSGLEIPKRFELHQRGIAKAVNVEAGSANLSGDIARRELLVVKERLELNDKDLRQRTYEASGPGNVVMVRAKFENHTEVFTGFGEHGTSAETIAKRMVDFAKPFLSSGAVVGEHLADQLLLPMAMGAGGIFTTTKPSLHFSTNVEIIKQFLDVSITIEPLENHVWKVVVG